MKRLPDGRVAVDPEALQDMTPVRLSGPCIFSAEDLYHLEDLILDMCGHEDLISCPGAEHVYAKIYRELYGELPPAQEE